MVAPSTLMLHLAPVLGLLAFPSPVVSQDPFAPGLRWLFSAPATDHWIPCDVTFAGAENLVWASSVGVEGRWSVLDVPGHSASGGRSPHFADAAPSAPLASVMSVAGDRADALFALRQELVTGSDKRSQVVRYDPLKAAAGAAFDPEWTLDLGLVSPGPARVHTDRDGRLVVAAVLDPSAGQVELSWIDGDSGALLHHTSVPGTGLNELQVSSDGGRIAVAAGLEVYVFGSDGTPIDHLVRTAATPALSLSRSGRVLAVGGSSQLGVWVQTPTGYRRALALTGDPVELALRAALSADGRLLAVAWWDRTTGVALRLETWDLVQGLRLLEFSQSGPVGGLQNVPEALSITPDGRRVALGTWGLGSGEPEVLLFDVDDPAPVFSVDLPGSVRDLALDRSGTRLVVAHKDSHANQFSSTGAIRHYDTGERDLRQLEPAVLGGGIHLAARRSRATAVFFLIGSRAGQPSRLPGVGGAALFLNAASIRVFPRRADSMGSAAWDFAVPSTPEWIGSPWSVQAAFRIDGSTELSAVVLDPLVLNP